MGAGNDRFIWNPGDGSDIVDGGDGFDTMLFNGANISEKMELSGANGQATFTRDVGNITMRLTSVEAVDVTALGGADNITVDDLTGSGVRQVAIDLSGVPGSGVGDDQADTVTVNGTTGNDHIRIASAGGAFVVSGLAAQVAINGEEAANDTLVINSQAGNDVVDASALQGGLMKLVLNGGTGNDTLIGSQGNDVLAGGLGTDTFLFGGNFGHDAIQDFVAGTGNGLNDVVQFDRSIFSSFADVQAHAVQIGNDTTITVDPNRSVTLQNVALNSLSASDFRFA
jgi:Ca2+-binding RTX toxin-like protein